MEALWKWFQVSLNFTVRRYSPADEQWGFLNKTNMRMTGLVGELHRGRADLCTAGLYLLKERQEYADMFGVVTDFSTVVLPRSLSDSGSQINLMAYLSIFSKGTWLLFLVSSVSIALVLLFSGMVLHLSKKWPEGMRQHNGFGDKWWSKIPFFTFVSEGVQVALLTVLQRGVNMSLDVLSTRLAFLTASMMAIIIFAYYNADLTAKMTHRAPVVKLRNFQVTRTFREL